jgi:hypothetical protein
MYFRKKSFVTDLFISKIFIFLSLAVVSFLGFNFVLASDTNGTIDTTYKYAWGETTGWLNFGCVFCDVAITDTMLTGNFWSSEYGWIKLNPVLSGVINDAEGNLSGFAWGRNIGWINFSGVTINADGEFLGYALINADGNSISFNCSNTATCGASDFKVKTDWRPASVRNPATPPNSGTSPSAPPSVPPAVPPTLPPPPPTVPPTPPTTPPIPPTPPPITPPDSEPVSPSPSDSSPSFGLTSYNYSYVSEIITERIIQPAVENIRNIITQPEVKAFEKVAVVVPVAISSLILTSSILSGVPILNHLFYLSVVLFQILGIRKRPKPWGTVYDAVTKKPIAFARVEILNEQMRKLQSVITDENGRYGFLVSESTMAGERLHLQAFRTKYVFPSKEISSPVEQELYANIYRGGSVGIENGITNFDIPMDPVDKTASQGFYFGIVSVKLNKIFTSLADILFMAGVVLGVTNAIINPNKTSIIILFVVLLTFLLRIAGFKMKPFGITRDSITNQVLPFGFIALHDKNGQRINFTVSDDKGRYFLLTKKGAFTLKASTPAHILPARLKEVPIFTHKGWISKEIGV